MEVLIFVAGLFIFIFGKGTAIQHEAVGQGVVDYIADNVEIEVGAVDNLHKTDSHVPVEIMFHNRGNLTIPSGPWKIYFYNLYGVRSPEVMVCDLKVGQVNGGLFYFEGSKGRYTEIAPNSTLRCTFYNKFWTVAKTDFFLNWYVTSPGSSPRIIESTRKEGSFVRDFDSPYKWKRSKKDKYDPFTPEQRYDMSKGHIRWINPHRIVPKPLTILEDKSQTMNFDQKTWTITRNMDFPFEEQFLVDALKIRMESKKNRNKRHIEVIRGNTGETDPEAYTLNIHPKSLSITVTATAPQGALHGVQSLISLIEGSNGPLHFMFIQDKPRYSYRGMLIDVARNFKPKAWMFKFIDAMSMYKLNKLHFHLTNDEGWRVEVPRIPELTQIGGKRCHSDTASECLIPQLGSGPFSNNTGSGFYSVQDYRDILKYANERHIEVIPEVDMPAHSYAAITAMNVRESEIKKLKSRGVANLPVSYLLSDQSGPSNVFSAQRWMRNAINPCLSTTYKFIEVIVDTLVEHHRPVQPLKTFHIGGDEVPEGVWNDSKACQYLIRNPNISTHKLQKMFIKNVADIIAAKGVNLGIVGEMVYGTEPTPRTFFKNSEVFVYIWDTRGEILNTPSDFADEGYKVILMPATHLYFDIVQEPDPEERGLFWSTRYIDGKKVFGFMPDNLLANVNVDPMGYPIDKTQNPKHSNASMTQNVIGIQATAWGELMKSEKELHYMTFPRLVMAAERGWHKANWEDANANVTQRETLKENDWTKFVATLGYKEMPRLENRGIHYRIPPPGAKLDGCDLKARNMYPNHLLEISLNKGRTWQPFFDITFPAGTHFVELRTKSIVSQRVGRTTKLQLIVDEKSVQSAQPNSPNNQKCLKTMTLISNHGYSNSSSNCFTNCKKY